MSLLAPYRLKVEQELEHAILRLGSPSRLREACSYACLNGGKRLRPILVLLIGEAIDRKRNLIHAALSVEYFHTASLIADDLPCMDNDDVRRSRPSLHRAFDEATALLASYTLIAAGYGALHEASLHLQDPQALSLSLEVVTSAAGLRGATHGQFLDLFPPDGTAETLREIIEKKTATLFEISFSLGWLFGGGNPSRLEEVKRCARHLGMAFQVADDLQDIQQEHDQSNFAKVLGMKEAESLFEEEFNDFQRALQSLELWTPPFQYICHELLKSSRRIEPGVVI
jgi:geranylgeranyl diphosphate synthase type II